MSTCKHLLEAFEKQLTRQKEIKAMRAAQLQTKVEIEAQPTFTPTGYVSFSIFSSCVNLIFLINSFCRRLQRNSKARAMDQVKAWCGAEMPMERKHGSFSDDEQPTSKKIKREQASSGDEGDFPKSPASKG